MKKNFLVGLLLFTSLSVAASEYRRDGESSEENFSGDEFFFVYRFQDLKPKTQVNSLPKTKEDSLKLITAHLRTKIAPILQSATERIAEINVARFVKFAKPVKAAEDK